MVYGFGVLFSLFCHTLKPGERDLPIVVIGKEIFEFSVLISLYLNVRPRNWPPFFSLELYEEFLDEILLQGNLQDLRPVLPP